MAPPTKAGNNFPAQHDDTDFGSNAPKDLARGPLPRSRRVRSFNITWLNSDGQIESDVMSLPPGSPVEDACSSMTRGTLVSTVDGLVAVEDLVPGQELITNEFGALPLKWIGSFEVPSNAEESPKQLIRITTDSFGISKPSHDLMIAPDANILLRNTACKAVLNADQAFAPAKAFEDGMHVILITPIARVKLFNIAFDRQVSFYANGIELESYFPDPNIEKLLDKDSLKQLTGVFPQINSLDAFGPKLTERLSEHAARELRSGG